MKVMIIEQEKTIQQSLYYFMERFKRCEVSLAGSAKEGLSLFESSPFDIVLCGDRLPDGSGMEILKALMLQSPKLVSVLLTVDGDEPMKQEALRLGIRGYLEKPFDLNQLEEAIRSEPHINTQKKEEGKV
jgi:DNA-binding NtrC family response regulator